MPTALILGASRGIGRELAQQYLAQGWQVYASARHENDLANLRELGCHALQLDVNKLNDCAGLAWQLDDIQLDVAILNAGVFGTRTEGMQSPQQAEFDLVMQTNVLAAMRILPLLLPLTDAAHGKLAVISSKMGSISLRAGNHGWLYRASKAALNSVLKDVSMQAHGSICVSLHPGWVQTDMGGANADLSIDEGARRIIATLAQLSAADNGSYIDASTGERLSW